MTPTTGEPEVQRYYEPYADVTPPLVKSKRGNFVLYSDYLRCAQERDAAVRERDAAWQIRDEAIALYDLALKERDLNSQMADAAIDDATQWEADNAHLRAKLAAAERDVIEGVNSTNRWREKCIAAEAERDRYRKLLNEADNAERERFTSALAAHHLAFVTPRTPTPPQEATNDDA